MAAASDPHRPGPRPEDSAWWHVRGFGRETHPAGKTYWWDNARRRQAGLAVVQHTRSGSIVVRDADGDHPAGPGTLTLFCHGDPLRYGQPQPLATPYVCRWVGLAGAGVDAHVREIARQHGPVLDLGEDHPLPDRLEALMLLAEPGRRADPSELASAIHRFVIDLGKAAEDRLLDRLTPIDRAIHAIQSRPHDPASVKEIAARFGVSREHLSRAFAQRVGRSAHEVQTEARCRLALSLLRETRLPIAEVARQSGFVNAPSLARHVRALTNRSPTAYRLPRKLIAPPKPPST
ncbi:MAG: AraC family transcriptional regulator [Planctomycetota bacterium]